ncbi:MAG TPA: 2-phosphosulfolactate phosphatase [Actinomycetota bacterium]|jgi:2-phosphosulfolactate phosphatase|nr:2-phosphosulfolactate phosphatase [Actinomycetota bacterium]
MSGPRVTIRHIADDTPLPAADAYVVVDVIRASTTAVTAGLQGRDCYLVRSVEEARLVAATLSAPLLAGEVHGDQPADFDLQNSPTELSARSDVDRPVILLTSSGSPTMCRAGERAPTWIGSLRNVGPTADALREVDEVAILAASPDELRIEDAICAARLALAFGLDGADDETLRVVHAYGERDLDQIRTGTSAGYLRRSGQMADLEFILRHVDDVDLPCSVVDGRVAMMVSDVRS